MIADAAGTASTSTTLCGTRTYTITDSSGNALTGSWVTVAIDSGATTFKITAAPANTNLVSGTAHSLKLHIVLASYTSITADITFSVTV